MTTTIEEQPTFLQRSARVELGRLQHEVALQRGILREQRRGSWEPDRGWQVKKVYAIRETISNIRRAETALADFIELHRAFLGEVVNGGRLCWHCFTGGQPIDIHYCELPEGHSGHHANSIGQWDGRAKHPEQKPVIPKPRLIAEEKRNNLIRFGTDWNSRSGPSIIMYRDTHWYQHPFRRSYSCRGCQYLLVEKYYGSARCAHPEILAKHEVPQAGATNAPRCLSPNWCPALGGDSRLTQPYPCPLPGCSSEYPAKPERVFQFTARLREAIRPLQKFSPPA